MDRHRRARGDRGFTLIELLVVIAIVGVLAAVAIPTFLNQRDKAARAATISNMRAAVNEIVLAREAANKPLLQITGRTYSAGDCMGLPEVPRVSDPAFAASACGLAWENVVTKIAAASGASPASVRALFTDGWGRPILLDENEAESQFGCNAQDALTSTGRDGLYSARWTAATGSLLVPLGGFC